VVEMSVPPIVEAAEFEAVQTLLKTRCPALTAPRVVSGPTLLTGICFCAALRRGDDAEDREEREVQIYTCSTKARQGETGCRAEPFPWKSSTASWPSTSRTGCCSPSVSNKSFHVCSIA